MCKALLEIIVLNKYRCYNKRVMNMIIKVVDSKCLKEQTKKDNVVPFKITNNSSAILTEDGKNLYLVKYGYSYKVTNALMPKDLVYSKKQHNEVIEVLTGDNEVGAKIYEIKNGLMDNKYAISYQDHSYICYDKSLGKVSNISIYDGAKEIGTILVPLNVTNAYYVFLLDEYKDLKNILALFSVTYRYLVYKNSHDAISEELLVEYTIDKNDKYYNENWVKDNFPKEEIVKIYDELNIQRIRVTKSVNKRFIISIVIMAVIFIILAIVLALKLIKVF